MEISVCPVKIDLIPSSESQAKLLAKASFGFVISLKNMFNQRVIRSKQDSLSISTKSFSYFHLIVTSGFLS